MTAHAIAQRLDRLEQAMPRTDFAKLTDAELDAALMRELARFRADQVEVLDNPCSTPRRRARAEGNLQLLAGLLV